VYCEQGYFNEIKSFGLFTVHLLSRFLNNCDLREVQDFCWNELVVFLHNSGVTFYICIQERFYLGHLFHTRTSMHASIDM
jgi:hypothetical protein